MIRKKLVLAVLVVCLTVAACASGIASAAAPIWRGPSDGGGWNGFMQVIMQQDYRQQMSNGNPYWNTLMLPVPDAAATSGMSSYMGMPAFGFCPVPGQCYMVLVQRPPASSSMSSCPPLPAAPAGTNQPDKPNSLW